MTLWHFREFVGIMMSVWSWSQKHTIQTYRWTCQCHNCNFVMWSGCWHVTPCETHVQWSGTNLHSANDMTVCKGFTQISLMIYSIVDVNNICHSWDLNIPELLKNNLISRSFYDLVAKRRYPQERIWPCDCLSLLLYYIYLNLWTSFLFLGNFYEVRTIISDP